MSPDAGPLLTRSVAEALRAARDAGAGTWTGSLDLGLSTGDVALAADAWQWRDRRYPYPPALKDRTIHYWDGDAFAPVSRFAGALIKLVPTEWGPPTFEIDGIKMLPTAKESPLVDARRKVALVEPHGKRVLDTCGGLGYFAACCLEAGAARVHSFEKNPTCCGCARSIRGRPTPTPPPAAAACSSSMPMCPGRSRSSPTPRWTRCCTTRHASASPASCMRRRSTTSSRACCAVADACSTTPAARTSSPAVAMSRARSRSGWRKPASRRSRRWTGYWRHDASGEASP